MRVTAHVASDQRAKILAPFFTTRRQGSGIRPTLVRRIAAAWRQRGVADTPGGGATFRKGF